jgi:surface protein
MSQMFYSCTALVSVVLFDTSSVTSMNNMFYFCQKLTVLPLFNTSKVSNMSYAFKNCYKLESGALALYRQASTQSTPPGYHSQTFMNCGKNTTTGAAELAQIPSDWK